MKCNVLSSVANRKHLKKQWLKHDEVISLVINQKHFKVRWVKLDVDISSVNNETFNSEKVMLKVSGKGKERKVREQCVKGKRKKERKKGNGKR